MTTITKEQFVNLTLEDKLAYLFERSQLPVEIELQQLNGDVICVDIGRKVPFPDGLGV